MATNLDLTGPGGIVTPNGAFAFFRRYPVVAMSKPLIDPNTDFKKIPIPPPPMTVAPGQRAPGEDDYDYLVGANRIKYLTTSTFADGRAPLQSPALGVNVRMDIKNAANAGDIPAFWLPYDLNHHRRMTLVDKQGIAKTNLFLTDMIDGCSIYVEGTPTAPTVTHLNANKVLPVGITVLPHAADQSATAVATRTQAWNLKWADMDRRHQNNPKPKRVRNADPALVAGRKLESQHYMFMTEAERVNFGLTLPTLQANNQVPTQVATATGMQSVDEMEALFTQATVFGVKDAQNSWRFYVQRRVLVSLYHLTFNVPPQPGRLDRFGAAVKARIQGPQYGPAPMQVNRSPLGNMWLIRSMNQFWPGNAVGTAAP